MYLVCPFSRYVSSHYFITEIQDLVWVCRVVWTLTCCTGNIPTNPWPSWRISGDVCPHRRSPLSSTAHLHPQKTTLFSGIWILCLSWTSRQRLWELLRDSSAAHCRWCSDSSIRISVWCVCVCVCVFEMRTAGVWEESPEALPTSRSPHY